MTFINTILDAENTAEEATTKARETANVALLNAQDKSKNDLVSFNKTLKEDRVKALAEQKPQLLETYKRILSVGTARANEINTNSSRNKDKAVSYILNNLA